MDVFLVIVYLALLVFAIMFYAKVWKMTSDVSDMKSILKDLRYINSIGLNKEERVRILEKRLEEITPKLRMYSKTEDEFRMVIHNTVKSVDMSIYNMMDEYGMLDDYTFDMYEEFLFNKYNRHPYIINKD